MILSHVGFGRISIFLPSDFRKLEGREFAMRYLCPANSHLRAEILHQDAPIRITSEPRGDSQLMKIMVLSRV